ncbi:MAG TPA: DegV family protein [Anaerolineae bacterium]|nr:DegV family protein [Anaerolineae bacterium]HQM13784.1 DegV family protein [Anaerolineae bacterium]
MNHVTVVTDSVANLPADVTEKYGIPIVPLRIVWDGEVFRDGVDITPQEFYVRLQEDKRMPTTSTIAPEELLQVLRPLAEEGKSIVAIFLAHELSATVDVAQKVQLLAPTLPLHVVDSRTAAMAEGFVVLEAARAAADGATVEQVVARAQAMIPRVHILGVVETLEYLRRGGRIGTAAAFLGSMLQMKPIVGIPPGHGSVIGVARPRTWKNAIEQMLELMGEEVGERPVHAAIGHGAREEEAHALAEALRQRFDVRELYITYFTPVMGVHTGPVLSISFYADEE